MPSFRHSFPNLPTTHFRKTPPFTLFSPLLTSSCPFAMLGALLFLCLAYFPPPASSQQLVCPFSEQQLLLNFSNSISPSNKSLNWQQHTNCCTWRGVTCAPISPSSQVQVIRLSLPSLGIRAPIPKVLGSLNYLGFLNLSQNSFYGSIPLELSSLVDLHTLDLSTNNLSGSVTLLGSMPSLQFINISNNNFVGSMPSYSNVTNVEKFYASKNSISGTITASICQNALNLSVLDFSWNNLDGSLGYGLELCTKLQVLNLGFNKLTGSIPDDLYNVSSLSILVLAQNRFTGSLKDSIGSMSNLTQLILCSNNLSGALPKSLSRISKLTTLDLSENLFKGEIDLDFSNMTYLEDLDLNSNSLIGAIPSSIANCTQLRILNLAKNQLTGQIPRQFNTMNNLTALSLSTNLLTGDLLSLDNCENLVSLFLTKNFFTDPLPSSVTGFRNVQVLALGFLNLKGRIPDWLQNCTKLQILDLSWNQFEGELPPWLGSFQHLTYLELSNNSFTGSIPLQLFTLTSMMHNDTNMTGLQTISAMLSVKRQTDSPDLMYNQAKALPPSLLLSNNKLSGTIPPQVGQLQALVLLDFSHNHLTGNIPETLANVTGLESLDLSFNELDGSIPSSLIRLTFLASFNVSYNHLSGQIPLSNQFSTFPNSSYIGNSGLCGYPILSHCANDGSLHNASVAYSAARRQTRTIALLVSICVGVGAAALLVILFVCLLSGKTAVHQGIESSREHAPQTLSEAYSISVELFHDHQKLTVGDLFKATNNFDSANIVGCGGFGLVYRADLGDGSQLAIKKLTGDCGQIEREFRAEVDALSKAQHRNLVSLQGYFHIGNDKLLIYSYMENGSLDYWLHERTDGGARLDWPTRLKIARGAAAGLAYLHQICNPHIVHRDIKSSNILLDERFEAHLADFGLARLMMSTETHVTTELVGTLGYIPPEYGEALNATPRGDVYSFGVVLLELLTGKRPVDVCKPRGSGDLVTWVQQMRQECKSDHIFDKLLQSKCSEEQMQQVLDVACFCINRNPLKRPSIMNIVVWLEEVGQDKHLIK